MMVMMVVVMRKRLPWKYTDENTDSCLYDVRMGCDEMKNVAA